ncbi:MAG TPA: hypothetical protein VGX97_01935 [bacterium]|nr:hypothetical protein [bacterium]
METVFGPEWLVQGLLAIGALGLFLALALILGDARPSPPVTDRETLERGRLAAFPPSVRVFLGDGGL